MSPAIAVVHRSEGRGDLRKQCEVKTIKESRGRDGVVKRLKWGNFRD